MPWSLTRPRDDKERFIRWPKGQHYPKSHSSAACEGVLPRTQAYRQSSLIAGFSAIRVSKFVCFFNTISPKTLSCLASTACKRISSRMARKAQTSAVRDRKLRKQRLQADRFVFQRQSPAHVVDHLRYGDVVFLHVERRLVARAVEDLLKRLDQVDDVGGELRLGAFRIAEFLQGRVCPNRLFDLLLLQQHLRRGPEAFVFEQAG